MVRWLLSASDFAAVKIYAMRDIESHPEVAPGRIRMRQDTSNEIGANLEYGWAMNQLPPAPFRGHLI